MKVSLLLLCVLLVGTAQQDADNDTTNQNERLRGTVSAALDDQQDDPQDNPQDDQQRDLAKTRKDKTTLLKQCPRGGIQDKARQSKQRAMDLANRVIYESKLFNVVTLEMDSSNMKALKNDTNVKRIKIDSHVCALPSVQPDEQQDAKKNNTRRDLQESVPWGIRAIQANRVIPGPDAASIKVCIVDMGYDINHVDLQG